MTKYIYNYAKWAVTQLILPSILRCGGRRMMTSSNGGIFRVTGSLCGEFTGDRRIPLTKASDAELWCFILSAPEYTLE